MLPLRMDLAWVLLTRDEHKSFQRMVSIQSSTKSSTLLSQPSSRILSLCASPSDALPMAVHTRTEDLHWLFTLLSSVVLSKVIEPSHSTITMETNSSSQPSSVASRFILLPASMSIAQNLVPMRAPTFSATSVVQYGRDLQLLLNTNKHTNPLFDSL